MRQNPLIYEINTWVWLNDLSKKYDQEIDLSKVPDHEWDFIASFGFEAVWLMGVWDRSPAGIKIALEHEEIVNQFRSVLLDFVPEDVVGSPYCIKNYTVDDHLGGPDGLAAARKELKKRGMDLILDFVPNHVAPDHLWTKENPEYFIRGLVDEYFNSPNEYLQQNTNIFARARDPYYPPWPDVIQMNAFSEGYRKASLTTIEKIARQCDGIRCDMAMLMVNRIFNKTWGEKAGPAPETEYWHEIIPVIKSRFPEFIFIGEVYWDMEWEMLQQGFDYCYDKRLYDRIISETAENIRLHLTADLEYQNKLVRFLENHDENRAIEVFEDSQYNVSAVTTYTLPGMKLLHEGQLTGRKIKIPVFLQRRPYEKENTKTLQFYDVLLSTLNQQQFHSGKWQLCEISGWKDNDSYLNLVAWSWIYKTKKALIICNLSHNSSQGKVSIPWKDISGMEIQFLDPLNNKNYKRFGDDILKDGLYVDLESWMFHLLVAE